MSDNEGAKGKANTGWSDRERLAYLVSLIEHSDTKFNFKTAPLPAGRSVIACERMVGRLKITLKTELEALKAGTPMPTSEGGAATSKKATTPRKRKGKEDNEANGDADGSPTKKGRGRPKKAAATPAVPAAAEDDEEVVKSEVKEEEAEEV